MTWNEIRKTRKKLLQDYPGAHIKVTKDRAEMVAEIDPKLAVAVIERSLPHFHRKTIETYRVLRGTLYVACGGHGHVLGPGESLIVESGNVHFARGASGPAWVEVLSEPAWTVEDHLIF